MTAYWGRMGAGVLFIQKRKVLLTLRSDEVLQPGTWGIPGGAVSLGTHDEVFLAANDAGYTGLSEDDIFDSAMRESAEELGALPEDFEVVDHVVYTDQKFQYHTFFVAVDIKWPVTLNWENDEYGWFNVKKLPRPLHFGVEYLIDQRPEFFR